MPKVKEDKPKTTTLADIGAGKSGRNDKAKLKGATFAEGEAMLSPGGAGQKKDGTNVPKAMGGKGASGQPKDEGPGQQANTSAEQEADTPQQTAPLPKADDGSWACELYPMQAHADGPLAGLTALELSSIQMYTDTVHYEVMNAILRGEAHEPAVMAKYLPVIQAATSGLRKMNDPSPEMLRQEFNVLAAPTGPAASPVAKKRGKLGRFVHGRTKEGKAEKRLAKRMKNGKAPHRAGSPGPRGDTSKRSRVYRKTKMSEGFAPVFGGLSVGQTYTEKGFLSTTYEQPRGNFGGITWHIWDPTGGKAIENISVTPQEGEVLFPPGMQMDIESLRATDNTGAAEYVANPRQRWPSEDKKSPQSFKSKSWVVEARMKANDTAAEEDETEDEALDMDDAKDLDADDTKSRG